MSICDNPMTWDKAKELIDTKHLELLYRSHATTQRYREYKRQLESQGDTVVKYIIRERLQWSSPSEIKPQSDQLFHNASDFKIIKNDFPYNYTDDISHFCVWSKLTIVSDPQSEIGDVTSHVKAVIDRYVQKTFVEHLGLQQCDVMWFRNYPILQSVKELSHIHVLIRGGDKAQFVVVHLLLGIQPAVDGFGLVVEKIVVQDPVSLPELQILQEQIVILARNTVEHIDAQRFGNDQSLADQIGQSSLQSGLVLITVRGVVEQIGTAQLAVLFVVQNGERQQVEREEVCDFTRLSFVFDDKSMDHFDLVLQIDVTEQPMLQFVPGEILNQFVSFLEFLQQCKDLIEIFQLGTSQPIQFALFGQSVLGDHLGLRGVLRQVAEPDIVQLAPIQRSVVVTAHGHRRRQHDPSSVQILEDTLQIDPSRDLLDQNRSQSLGSELLVHTDEVDLHGFNQLFAHFQITRSTGDETNESPRGFDPDTDVPFFLVARRLQRPVEKLGGVFEPERGVSIFDIILIQQLENFIAMVVSCEIQIIRPFEQIQERVWLQWDVLDRFVLDWTLLGDLFVEIWNWLSLPKLIIF
ncbi:hypothetical protein WICPIJ_002331 [Wickerhamomyces pijperi]|uniref:Uncharacterized protein n=1 Tax=Wickerhamomyces pijperi TaxID=599730 RepID=A0A9P8Q967_WICPI|nr:hypothetical protein WICPIJ_002331 [Wickerhamomyces pijperi]